MSIKGADFAEECVRQALFLGVNPYYLTAVAQLRSGIADDTQGDRIGPFRLTQTEWDANCFDAEFGFVDFEATDIKGWDMQCAIYALMTLRAQNRLLEQLGRYPNAIELYREQWPDDPVELPAKLQEAVGGTSALVDAAAEKVVGEPAKEAPQSDNTQTPASEPAADTTKPSPQSTTPKPTPQLTATTFAVKAPRIMSKLMDDFGLTGTQAAGILGNIGHECDGFRLFQEVKPIGGGRGGFGWAQWTGPRRDAFEAFCRQQGLSPISDAANHGFLKRELETTHKAAVQAVKGTSTLAKAVREFERIFERAHPDHKHFESRDRWAQRALDGFKKLLPSALAKVLDPDLIYELVASAKSGDTTYWIVDQFDDDGGQVLIKQTSGKDPEILAADTTIFPLKPGIVPAGVAAALSATSKPIGDPHPPIAKKPPQTDQELSDRVFATTKQCDETLVTRNVPNTNHGRVACAWAVNEVVRRALGKAIGGGLSTVAMSKVLRAEQKQVDENDIAPGTIVISPTAGKNVGHVGIVGKVEKPISNTIIYSNSSKRGVFSHAFTLATWKNFYKVRKGLPVLFYALTRPH